jgi:hypothetical protein
MVGGEPVQDPGLVEEGPIADGPSDPDPPWAAECASSQFPAQDSDEPWADFWRDGLYTECPINFHLPTIRKYFEEQKAAYLAYAKSLSDYKSTDDLPQNERDEYIYSRALFKPYSKAWYEFQINRAICAATRPTPFEEDKMSESLRLVLDLTIKYSAILGRLIEQYYWKCNFEKKATTGNKLSLSGKDGAAQSAAKHKAEHAWWQAEANLIWKASPSKSKASVASIVKKRLGIKQSIKQIVRVLKHPLKDNGADARQMRGPTP